MKLQELCKAYRNGNRWYIYDGSREAVSTCRTGLFAELGIPVIDDVPNGNHWELWREISFRILGTEPFSLNAVVDDSADELHNVSAADIITIGKCISKTYPVLLGEVSLKSHVQRSISVSKPPKRCDIPLVNALAGDFIGHPCVLNRPLTHVAKFRTSGRSSKDRSLKYSSSWATASVISRFSPYISCIFSRKVFVSSIPTK